MELRVVRQQTLQNTPDDEIPDSCQPAAIHIGMSGQTWKCLDASQTGAAALLAPASQEQQCTKPAQKSGRGLWNRREAHRIPCR